MFVGTFQYKIIESWSCCIVPRNLVGFSWVKWWTDHDGQVGLACHDFTAWEIGLMWCSYLSRVRSRGWEVVMCSLEMEGVPIM